MNNRVLYISNQRVDLPDSVSFNLKWQCAEPGELKIYGSGSTTIRLPFTPANDAVFRYSKFLTVIGGREFETFTDCRYYERGRLMISGGTAFLVAISEGYEICLTWGNGDYVQSLKDKSVADLGGDTFQWDNSVPYPRVETSQQPGDYATFYEENGQQRFRHALTRPLYIYRHILDIVGINNENCPEIVWNGISKIRLQANSLQAKGRYVVSEKVGGSKNVSQGDYYTQYAQLGSFTIEENDTYKINLNKVSAIINLDAFSNPINTQEELNVCVFISELNQVDKYIGVYKGYPFAFQTDDGTYQDMRISNDPGAFLSQDPIYYPYSTIKAIARCVVGKNNSSGVFVNQQGGNDIILKKGVTYYIYMMPNVGGHNIQFSWDQYHENYGAYFNLKLSSYLSAIGQTSTADTKIETPDDPTLAGAPPRVVQMLGYSTAHDIVQDFMRLFPLMVILRNGKPQFFDLTTVLNNKANAYDFSPYFVSLDKIEFGNSKVGLRNEAKFADYEDFTGKRANGVFTTVGGKGNGGEYTQLAQITSYDTFTTFRTSAIPYFPAAEISYDDKTKTYKAKLQDRPNLLLYISNPTAARVQGDDGNTYSIFSTNGGRDTLQFIIDNYWQDFVNIVGTQKTVTVKLNIDPGALFDFDFRRPVYMKQLSVYVFAQKINYKGAGVAELQGIVLPSTSTGTPKPIDDDGMLVDATDTYIVDSKDKYIVEN